MAGPTTQNPPLVVTSKGLLAELVKGGLLGADGVIPLDSKGLPLLSERMPGAHVHHKMGPGSADGELRLAEGGGVEIFLGTGQGGESFAWQSFNPDTPGHVTRAWFQQRYGPDWSSGGGQMTAGFFGHAPDVRAVLKEQVLHRDPTDAEVYDIIYGVSTLKAPTPAVTPQPPATKPAPDPAVPPPTSAVVPDPTPAPAKKKWVKIDLEELEPILEDMREFLATLPDNRRIAQIRTFHHNIVLVVDRAKNTKPEAEG